MTNTVGIIGLGIMGSAYAKNLIASEVTVQGCDPVEKARDNLRTLGGSPHSSLGPWLNDCDLIILSLLSPDVLRDVVTTLATLLGSHQVVMDTGTFALADKFAAENTLAAANITLIDCPVSGTGVQAEKADLVMMMSGPPEAMQTAMRYAKWFTKKIIECGDFGNGSQMKYIANHAVALHNTAAAETLSYADALGLDKQMVLSMLSSGAGQSKMSDLRMPLMIDGTYEPPTASLKMFEKDLSVIGDDIRRLGLYTPLFDCCDELYAQASRVLPETHDTAAVYEVYHKREKS